MYVPSSSQKNMHYFTSFALFTSLYLRRKRVQRRRITYCFQPGQSSVLLTCKDLAETPLLAQEIGCFAPPSAGVFYSGLCFCLTSSSIT